MNILLVDDSPIVIKYLRFHLKSEKLNILDSDSGESAVKLIKNGLRPDLIIADYAMNNGDGMSLLNFILKNDFTSKFVFYTHYIGIKSPFEDYRFLGSVEKANFDKLHELVKKNFSLS